MVEVNRSEDKIIISSDKPGIVTHNDLDGIVSAMMICENKGIDPNEVVFVDYNETDKVKLQGEFYVCDLPYIKGAAIWFDHHSSNIDDNAPAGAEKTPGWRKEAKSCARVLAEYYKLTNREELLNEVDKIDFAEESPEDILNPEGYSLLSCLVKKDTTDESSMDFNRRILSLLREYDIRQVLEDPQIKTRADKYKANLERVKKYWMDHCYKEDNVTVFDLRNHDEPIYAAPAFKQLQFALEPENKLSIVVYDNGHNKTRLRVGWNVLYHDRKNCPINIGNYLKKLHSSGGGHKTIGSITVDSKDAKMYYTNIIKAFESVNNA